MKQFKTLFCATLLAVLLSPFSLFAATINKDKIVGTWQINAEISADVPYKNWAGSVTVTRNGNDLAGVLNWSNAETGWQVQESLLVTVKGNTITLKGTAVEVLNKPENDMVYHLDSFVFSMDDLTEQTVPVSAADGHGTVATFIISKS